MGNRNEGKILLNDFTGGVLSTPDIDFIATDLNLKQLISSKNTFWRHGLQKRKGMTKRSPNQPNGNNPIVDIHRRYSKTDLKQLLVASGGSIYSLDEATGTYTLIKSGFSSRIRMTTYGPTERVLIADGLNIAQSWDGTTISEFTGPPSGVIEFVTHRDRLFAHGQNTTISYSDNLDIDTWSSASLSLVTDDPFITKMIVHTQSIADSSVVAQLLIFTANTIWTITGVDFTNLSDIVLHELTGQVGTNSPNTVVKTPKGIMFFGREQGRNDVFLVIGEGLGARVVSIGQNIRRELQGIPSSGMDEMTATYFDGYYRLSIRDNSNLNNKKEWWLKLDDINLSNIAWYGPMERSIGMQSLLPLSGINDDNILLGGGEDGYLYHLDQTLDDDGIVIPVDIQTGFFDFGSFSQEKRIKQLYLLMQASSGSVDLSLNIDFSDRVNESKKTITLTTGGAAFPYDFPFNFSISIPNIKTIDFRSINPTGIYTSLRVEFSALSENFLLNSLGISFSINNQNKREN